MRSCEKNDSGNEVIDYSKVFQNLANITLIIQNTHIFHKKLVCRKLVLGRPSCLETFSTTLYNVCSVHRGMFSTSGRYHDHTSGDIMSISGGYSTLGDIMSTSEMFSTSEFSIEIRRLL